MLGGITDTGDQLRLAAEPVHRVLVNAIAGWVVYELLSLLVHVNWPIRRRHAEEQRGRGFA
jgi:hypothetical protein